MADYYTNFSFIVDISESEKLWIDRYLELRKILVDEDHYDSINMEYGESRTDADYEAWFYSYGCEYSSVDAVSDLIRRFLIKFDRDDVIVIDWASDCSKPRIDGFGGGAAVISRLGVDYINTTVWAHLMSQEIECKLIKERTSKIKQVMSQ